MGSPREWELDLNKNENAWNTTTWEWERLMLEGSQNHSRGLVKCAHFVLVVAFTQRPIVSSVTQW